MIEVPGYEIVAASELAQRSIFLLHGIMGSMRNWRSFAKRLVTEMPEWRVVLVDIRGHGLSRDLSVGPHNLESCAEDLERLAEAIGRPELLIGHSFGGKVVVEAARRMSADALAVAVLDCPMRESRRVTNSEVGRVFELLSEIEMPVPRRSDVVRRFNEAGFERSLSGWMATNLVDSPSGQVWHFDVEVLKTLLSDYWQRDYLDYLADPGPQRRFLLVKAEKSDRFDQDELDRLAELVASGAIEWAEVPAAGHWLHIDNPDGLILVLEDFLKTL